MRYVKFQGIYEKGINIKDEEVKKNNQRDITHVFVLYNCNNALHRNIIFLKNHVLQIQCETKKVFYFSYIFLYTLLNIYTLIWICWITFGDNVFKNLRIC